MKRSRSSKRKSNPAHVNVHEMIVGSLFSNDSSKRCDEYILSLMRCHCGYSPKVRISKNSMPGMKTYYCGKHGRDKCAFGIFHSEVRLREPSNTVRICMCNFPVRRVQLSDESGYVYKCINYTFPSLDCGYYQKEPRNVTIRNMTITHD